MEFTITADLLSELAEACALVASPDESRPILQSVHMYATGEHNELRCDITDSYRLLRLTAQKVPVFPEFDVIVNAKDLAAAVKPYRSSRKSDADNPKLLTIEVGDNQLGINHDGNHTGVRLEHGDFPDIDKVIPDKYEILAGEPVGLNAGYVGAMDKIYTKFRGSPERRVDLVALHPSKPSVWELPHLQTVDKQNVDGLYVLMPVRRS